MEDLDSLITRMQAASGDLGTLAVKRMEIFPWYRELSADQRAWVAVVAQAGIGAFMNWYSIWAKSPDTTVPKLTTDVFGAAPRELARVISLEQTVELVRTTIDAVESQLDTFLTGEDLAHARIATLQYSREVAFSAAEVYARAAEARGAWDARLEALILDALIRSDVDSEILSRIAALGWSQDRPALVLAGSPPDSDNQESLSVMRRAARSHSLDLLTGIHGPVMLVIIGGAGLDPHVSHRLMTPYFGPGPVVVTESVNGLAELGVAARMCVSGVAAARAWPHAPRPVFAGELLAERALMGEDNAHSQIIENIFNPLSNDPTLLDTAESYLENGQSLEASARALFVHANTIRYRIKGISELIGYDLTDPRDAFTVRLALILGRISQNA
jgi:DNA-binding PucR family transcriptional regulator